MHVVLESMIAEEKKSDEGFMRVGRLFNSSRKFFMKMEKVPQCRTRTGETRTKYSGDTGGFIPHPDLLHSEVKYIRKHNIMLLSVNMMCLCITQYTEKFS
jgi:hypothetical protein